MDSTFSLTMASRIYQDVILNLLLVSSIWCISVPRRDMCVSKYPSHLYVVLGERGQLFAENISIPNSSQVESHTRYQCSVQLVTCSTCVIYLVFRELNLPLDCGEQRRQGECPCDHVWLSEQDKVPRAYFCSVGKDLSYQSQTRYLSINFSYATSHKHPFHIEYVAERNRQYMKGAPGDTNITFGGVLKSPFFPAYYPRDLGVEYVISCIKTVEHCRVKLIFTDFLISVQSVMERSEGTDSDWLGPPPGLYPHFPARAGQWRGRPGIAEPARPPAELYFIYYNRASHVFRHDIIKFYDWTGHKLRLTNGIKPRPAVILSSGPSLMIRFLANSGYGLGYKGNYYFITGQPDSASLLPVTDCGGEVENLGGAITMMNMVRGPNYKYYDCVWLIKPISTFGDQDLLLYMAVITFTNMGLNSEISIYEGQTSEGNLLDIIKPFSVIPKPQYTVSVHSGFYISLKATFKNSSSVAISYAEFSNRECIGENEFLCKNQRCINKHLYCDGYDHCGDNTDEPDTCSRDWKYEPIDRRWNTHTPNYYFPKTDNYLDMKTATFIFILGSIGLIILLGTLVFLVYRMGMRTRQQRELQDRLQTITDLFGGKPRNSSRRRGGSPKEMKDLFKGPSRSPVEGTQVSEMDLNDDPPNYEPPPSYEEVMKKEKEKMLNHLNAARTVKLPDSPPPPYRDGGKTVADVLSMWAPFSDNLDGAGPSSPPPAPLKPVEHVEQVTPETKKPFNLRSLLRLGPDCDCAGACSCAMDRRSSLAATWSPATSRLGIIDNLLHSLHSIDQPHPDSKGCSVKGSMSADNIFCSGST